MLTVHRSAAMKKETTAAKKQPVTTIKVHPWLLGYLRNPAVEWVNGNTLFVWNSEEHKRLMNRPEVMR